MRNIFLFLTCLQLSGQSEVLFKKDQIIELTLYGQIKDVFKDRGESSNYHKASVIHNLGGAKQEIPLKLKLEVILDDRHPIVNCLPCS